MPKVSVIIPFYDRAATLPRCIQSVRAQTFSDWEMLAVDDCSRDDSARIVESFGDPRIRVLRHPTNRGASVARQTGLEAAGGEFIAILDSDDEWLPEKLERQLASGGDAVGCGYFVRQDEEEWVFRHPPVTDWVAHLHFRCMIRAGSTLLARRSLAQEVGGFDPALRFYEDWDFALRLAERAPLTMLAEPLVRIHVGGPRSFVDHEPSVRRFLAKHAAAFHQRGATHRRRVCAQHLQNLAAGAFAERRFALGARWLIESYAANPLQSPLRLGALALAPVDALCGTSWIERAAEMVRQKDSLRPAP